MKSGISAILIAVVMMAAGCNLDQAAAAKTYAVNTATAVSAVTVINDGYEGVAEVIRASSLPDETKAELRTIGAELERIRDAFNLAIEGEGGAGQVLVNASLTAVLYDRAVVAYRDAKALVDPHKDALPLGDRLLLEEYDRQAVRLSEALEALQSTPDGGDISGYVDTAVGVAAAAAEVSKLLLLVL